MRTDRTMNTLINKLSKWRPTSVAVAGDVMLDELVYGDAERLTADAPVPVLAVKRSERIPGGAANVCLNLRALGADVSLHAVVGDDEAGHTLRQQLTDAGVNTDNLITDPNRPTTVKRSLIGLAQHRHPQKMFRLDIEDTAPIDPDLAQRLAESTTANSPDIIAIEDYNKGLFKSGLAQQIIARARQIGIRTLVDPASIEDYARYAHASCITPNRTEAERATRLPASSPEKLAHQLKASTPCDNVVLTLDRDGALLLEHDRDPVAVPTLARDVYDVTGAGDMVLAALAASLANDLSYQEATHVANAAAGLEVEVFGVKPIPFERVYQSVLENTAHVTGKLRTPDQAKIHIRAAKAEHKSVVFTNGCFDIIHAGHIHMLRAAKALGDLLILGINTDESVRRLKGPERPIHDENDRVTVLSELEAVDIIVLFSDDTPIQLIKELRPDILAKGADYTREAVVGADFVEHYGGRVELIQLLEGRSTTSAIERIRAT